MAVTIQSDPTIAGYNCFCSLAEATTYHGARLHNDSWLNASTTEKSMALVWATTQLSTLTWKGSRTSGTQLLAFPRVNLSYTESSEGFSNELYDSGFGSYTTITVPSTLPPTEIKNATAELALWLLQSDKTAESDLAGFKRLKVDVIEIEPLAKDRPDWFVDPVRNLCKIFLKNSSGISAPVSRVG